MKDFFVKDCAAHENQNVTSSFVVASKQVKAKKNGEPYLALTLCDRTGTIEAKIWDNVADVLEAFEQDDVVKVKGLLNKYNNRWQLTIHKLRKADEPEIDFADYLPKTSQDIDQLWKKLGEFVASVKNLHLQALLQAFIADPEIVEGYRTAPAAKTLHHAFVGGLLEHVVSLMTLCDRVAGNYGGVDRDLLITGAFLHDIGKIYELSYGRSFSYTTRGQLLGHMIIELEMLHGKIAVVNQTLPTPFPEDLKNLIEHLIISHHGQYEFGSPKLPMFPEALMLHYLDDLDSKMESMRAHFARETDSEWTTYNPSLGRTLLNSGKIMQKTAVPPAAIAAAAGDATSEKS
jgi:3'-5' exoribonuclease